MNNKLTTIIISILHNIMIVHFIITLCFASPVLTSGEQNFTYAIEDFMNIPGQQESQISLSLTMEADEYINSGSINISLFIKQQSQSINGLNPFNLLYFNLQLKEGRQCYYNYSHGKRIVQTTRSCMHIDNQNPCMNYSDCLDENITYQYRLESISYIENIMIIQNNNDLPVIISTKQEIFVLASNAWFYWTIGLACLLLINLVFFTGVVFYWSLRYKKTKKQFDQFKLTEGSKSEIRNQNINSS